MTRRSVFRQPYTRHGKGQFTTILCPMVPRSIAALAAGLALVALPAASQPVTVTDGDTIKFNGAIYRLWGIDAPEAKQWCGDYPAGAIASGALVKLVEGAGSVTCEAKATDRYGRTVAICRADGRDLGRAMVRLGMAWAFVRYSDDYIADQKAAAAAGLGIHHHDCVPAWDWRAARRH